MRTAAGMFDAAACSIALTDPATQELVYEAAWGAGASEVVGMRLPPGVGLAGAVVASGEGAFVPECRKDPRFARQVAAGTGYVPYTMVVAPLIRDGKTIGCLSVLDRRDGGPYLREDLDEGRAVRRPRRGRARPGHVPAELDRRSHAPGLTVRCSTWPRHVRVGPVSTDTPLRRDHRRLGLRRLGHGLPARRGRQARAASSSAAARTRRARSRAARTAPARASGTRRTA